MIKEESKNFRLIGHDPSAAFGCGSLVEIRNGHAYVGSVGVDGVEGFTVHDVQDPRHPRKVWEFKAPPGIHMHKLRYVHENLLYVNSERLPGDRGGNAQGDPASVPAFANTGSPPVRLERHHLRRPLRWRK